MLIAEERNALLQVAREAVSAAAHDQPYEPPAPPTPALAEKRGAFVTLKERGDLRGCIGFTEPLYPLIQTVALAGEAAAVRDPRFDPVRPAELPGLRLEISALTPVRPIDNVDEIVVGEHGLVIRQGGFAGLLLPQVATEWGWNREQFLAHTCRKAGLPPDAWRHGAQIFVFSAEVFGEEED